MKARFLKYNLRFKQPGATSRGVLHTKETYFLIISKNKKRGVGECGLFRGLSIDDRPDYIEKLEWLCRQIEKFGLDLMPDLTAFPSIKFGFEQAIKSLEQDHPFMLFPGPFSQGKQTIKINGLIWMASAKEMQLQIKNKIDAGFKTLKLKIGALDFKTELELIQAIRKEFNSTELELRVDANGAFDPNEALEKLKCLSQYDLHSIEQPIKQGQWPEMADLCLKTPLPIALDEELIGILDKKKQIELLKFIKPQYIILKPSLIGGFQESKAWINLAEQQQVGWWITSALESNIGLNAIAQFTSSLDTELAQGLGTGSLFSNNIESPLYIKKDGLAYDPNTAWKFNL